MMTNEQLSALIDQLATDLRAVLPVSHLVLYRAASELLLERWQQTPPDELRYATSHLALAALGVTDAAVERAKQTLDTGRDPTTLDRRQ